MITCVSIMLGLQVALQFPLCWVNKLRCSFHYARSTSFDAVSIMLGLQALLQFPLYKFRCSFHYARSKVALQFPLY